MPRPTAPAHSATDHHPKRIVRLMGAVLLAGALSAATGCWDDRKPIPVYAVVVQADGGYLLDGRPVSHEGLLAELRKRAEDPDVGRPGGPFHRASIRLIPESPAVDYNRVQDLVGEITGLGYSNIEAPH